MGWGSLPHLLDTFLRPPCTQHVELFPMGNGPMCCVQRNCEHL